MRTPGSAGCCWTRRSTSGPNPSSPRKMLPIPATSTPDVITPATCVASSDNAAHREPTALRPQLQRPRQPPPRLWRSSPRLALRLLSLHQRFDFIGGEVQVAAVPFVQLGCRVVVEHDPEMVLAVDVL